MKIRNLFKKPNGALEKLQSALEQNALDEAWLQSLRTEAERLAADRKAAMYALSENANEGTASTFIECDARCRSHESALREAHQLGHRSVAARCFERTQAPLKGALAAATAELRTEIQRVTEADEAAARTLGMTADDCRSPVRHRLSQEVARGEKILAETHLATEIGHLKNGLKFLEK